MIYVSERQLQEVEYIIQQSAQGNHVLFDTDTLRRVFAQVGTSLEEAYSVEHHIERMMTLPTIADKRAYLESLERGVHDHVVRTYFNIVENKIYENHEVRH